VGTICTLAGSMTNDEHAVTLKIDVTTRIAMKEDEHIGPNR
jgi:hypothetical protein